MTKLAIFDLDGTILNTVEDIANACNYALRELNFPERPLKDYNILCGKGIFNLFAEAMPEGAATKEKIAKMHELFISHYQIHNSDYTKPYEGICEMLSFLSSKGILLAVASNKYEEGVKQLVKHYFPNVDFLCIAGQKDEVPIKPHPQIIENIIQKGLDRGHTISKEEVVFVGDSDVDIQTGINAKVKTIAVSWGFRSREELLSYKPWKMVDKVTELLEAIAATHHHKNNNSINYE